MALIALYGTLMTGLGGQERLGVAHRLELVGPCVLQGALVALGWYPGLVAEPAGRVRGELHRLVDPEVLDVLDRYEGPDYERVRVRTLEPGVEAWTYLYVGEVPPDSTVSSGDWRAHTGSGGVVEP